MPGGHNDGSVWDAVIPLLEREGHTVFAPTLTDPAAATLDGHIAEVCDLIGSIGWDPIILAGHSYGAMVITGTASRIPERIARLVHIDSAVPVSGESLFGFMQRCGAGYLTTGLVPDRPFTDPLVFDETILRGIPKTYIHCTKSEFLAVSKCAYAEVVRNARRDRWTYHELESVHHCMATVPDQVAAVLLGQRTPDGPHLHFR